MAHSLYVLSVWIHILAAAFWIGGMLFLVVILVPALRKLEDRQLAVRLVRETGRRFRLAGWIALITLAATGTSNLYLRGVRWPQLMTPEFWKLPFGSVLAAKLSLVLVILVISAVHDFSIGPRASASLQANPTSPEALRLRSLATWFGRLNLLLALIVAACGVMLVRGRPW